MSLYTWRDWRDVLDVRELEDIRERTGYAIQSQYSASRRILDLADSFQSNIDPHIDIALFYDKTFNITRLKGSASTTGG